MTDLAHSCRGVDISLNARQDGAVVHQKDAVLLPTAALQATVVTSVGRSDPHRVLPRVIIRGLGVIHPYHSKRQNSSWNADGDCRIVAAPIDLLNGAGTVRM